MPPPARSIVWGGEVIRNESPGIFEGMGSDMITPNGLRLGLSPSEPAEPEDRMQSLIAPSILAAIGRTPLIRLGSVAREVPAQILVKLEAMNPGGSIKDRVGVAMVEEAERRGWLRPGGTIIEATAGNTGVGLAIVAAVKGYRCVFVLPDKMSGEKIRLLKAYGAEIVITPTSVPPDSAESYNGVADRLTREIPGAWRPNQFSNLANPEVHYRTTGPEIWEQTGGRITVLVAGVGTGGTISGVGRYLKEQDPSIKVVGADPEGSVLSGDSPKPWKVEGIGEDFVPKTFNGQLVDEWIRVGDGESFRVAQGTGSSRGAACRRFVGNGRRGRTRDTPGVCRARTSWSLSALTPVVIT